MRGAHHPCPVADVSRQPQADQPLRSALLACYLMHRVVPGVVVYLPVFLFGAGEFAGTAACWLQKGKVAKLAGVVLFYRSLFNSQFDIVG